MKTFTFFFAGNEKHSVKANDCWQAMGLLVELIGDRARNSLYHRVSR